jgi:hypothetical protein
MRPDQRQHGRFTGKRPFPSQQRASQQNQFFDSNGPNFKIRGSAYQIFERYITLAREAAISGDRIAAENFFQHAEHYFRVANASREGNQQGILPPATPAAPAISGTEQRSSETDVERSEPSEEHDRPGFI